MPAQLQLFKNDIEYPPGFSYLPDFISPEKEEELLQIISKLSFSSFEMHGVEAKRKIIHFGMKYDFLSRTAVRSGEIPSWLQELKHEVSTLLRKEVSQILVTHYPKDAPIGWHYDAPTFESLFGLSLKNSCRFRLRKGDNSLSEKFEIALEPRSGYIVSGEARTLWQHHIPPVKEERYSITFRSLQVGRTITLKS